MFEMTAFNRPFLLLSLLLDKTLSSWSLLFLLAGLTRILFCAAWGGGLLEVWNLGDQIRHLLIKHDTEPS